MLTGRTIFRTSSDQTLLICTVDPGPLSVEQAHRAMQVHLECDVLTCRCRRRARATLVELKRMVLDDRAVRVELRR
ncbi:hypothetical protein [Nocardia ignorata]|uniref:Uncharacterized protein n=1 Tax=Nocardia ignorata TaxID=145285 RepID=A0A4R6NZ78_NOCIG|nr:hypothetical protein [Nocardia ignorata]TDP29853.1 hypothetical protein DFR75_112122 [Nocardia ignorata]